MIQELTNIERAAIYFGVNNGLKADDIFLICHSDHEPERVHSLTAQWKRTKRVAEYFDAVKAQKEKRDQDLNELRRFRNESGTDAPLETDFTDKAAFIDYLNRAANRITDDKLKNDYLKMLSDHLDFKDEQKRDDSSQVQRFYLPLRCQDCKLYQEKLSINE
jgi:hypothetical protein